MKCYAPAKDRVVNSLSGPFPSTPGRGSGGIPARAAASLANFLCHLVLRINSVRFIGTGVGLNNNSLKFFPTRHSQGVHDVGRLGGPRYRTIQGQPICFRCCDPNAKTPWVWSGEGLEKDHSYPPWDSLTG